MLNLFLLPKKARTKVLVIKSCSFNTVLIWMGVASDQSSVGTRPLAISAHRADITKRFDSLVPIRLFLNPKLSPDV